MLVTLDWNQLAEVYLKTWVKTHGRSNRSLEPPDYGCWDQLTRVHPENPAHRLVSQNAEARN